jgi:hypothetical protein
LLNIENDKIESPIKDKSIHKENNFTKEYISLKNNNYNNYNKYIQNKKAKNMNKKNLRAKINSPSTNTLHRSTLDSSFNFKNNNYNNLNKSLYSEILVVNPNASNLSKNNLNNYTFDKLNKKFNSLIVDGKRGHKSFTNIMSDINNKSMFNTYNSNSSNKLSEQNLKRAFSSTKLFKKRINPYEKDINNKFNEIKYNSFYIKSHSIKYNKNTFKKSRRNDFFKIKISSIIKNFDKDFTPNKKPIINYNKNSINYKLLDKYNKSTNIELNILNTKENDIKKFNVFAKSKLMDINDIKNINKKNNFFDYNYNRDYKKRIHNNNNLILDNNIIKIIPQEIKVNNFNNKNKQKLDELFEYLK